MKFLGINGSPHQTIANTYQLLNWIAEPFKEEKWDVEIVNLSAIDMKYCAGCGICLRQGECPQDDDIKMLQTRMMDSDVIVLGSPVYVLQVTGQMKTFLDRCLPIAHRPCLHGKVGASVSVYAGVGSAKAVANYMNGVLGHWGASIVGSVSAFAVSPNELTEEAREESKELALKIIEAVSGKKKYPESEINPQMKKLIMDRKEQFTADYEYWVKKGWIEE